MDESASVHDDFSEALGGASRSIERAAGEESGAREPAGRADQPSFEVHCARSGEQALAMVEAALREERPYAVTFVAMLMLQGPEKHTIIQNLWRIDPNLELVVYSAHSSHDRAHVVDALGQSDQLLFLTKPHDGREVVQLAHSLCRKWAFRRDAERVLGRLDELVEQRTAELQGDNERLNQTIRERRELARNIQETLNPPSTPVTLGAMSLAGYCETCEECGGDWWTFQMLDGERLLLAVGDVTGHGVPAAMIAAAARGAVGAMVEHCRELTPGKVLSTLDRVVRDVGRGHYWMTCVVALFDPHDEQVQFANAGHPLPFVIRHKGTLHSLVGQGNPLGSPSARFPEKQYPMQRGEIFTFYSDGVTERGNTNGEPFGEKRLRAILREHRPDAAADMAALLRDRMLHAMREFGGGAALQDDLTLVMCQYL